MYIFDNRTAVDPKNLGIPEKTATLTREDNRRPSRLKWARPAIWQPRHSQINKPTYTLILIFSATFFFFIIFWVYFLELESSD